MEPAPLDLYGMLMTTVRGRLDAIKELRNSTSDDFFRAETAAFHGRKVVEATAFACLVAVENGIKHVPRDAKGQWNAEVILKGLKSKNIETLPSPSIIRNASLVERQLDNVTVVIEGIPERRISHDELIAIYQRLHCWLHEINPYTGSDRYTFYAKNGQSLWNDLIRIDQFLERHFISISGHGFFCVLRDSIDSSTKVVPLSRPPSEEVV